jgi:hypothetical protein
MIKAIEIEIGKKVIRLSPEECQELYRELKGLHEKETQYVPFYPYWGWNQTPSIPGYPYKYGTWTTVPSGGTITTTAGDCGTVKVNGGDATTNTVTVSDVWPNGVLTGVQ